MVVVTTDDVVSAFAEINVKIDDETALAAVDMCSEVGITASKLALEWEAFSLNNKREGDENMRPNTNSLDTIKKKIQLALSSSKPPKSSRNPVVQRPTPRKPLSFKPSFLPTDSPISPAVLGVKREPVLLTPSMETPTKFQKRETLFSPSTMQSPPAPGLYEQRKNPLQVIESMNSTLKRTRKQRTGPSVRIVASKRNVPVQYRYMYTPLIERARVLEKMIQDATEALLEKSGIATESLARVGDISQDVITVCGRICCDAAEGRINRNSILLEGSRKESDGLRIPLDLTNVPAYSLFPGQLVCVQGVNNDGRKIIVHKIFQDFSAPIPRSPATALKKFYPNETMEGDSAISIIAACGPFCTTDNLDYLPFNDLMAVVASENPDVLVLAGPFVDIQHPRLAEGDLIRSLSGEETAHLSFEDLFLETVFYRLEAKLQQANVKTRIVLIPSLRDAHHDFVYPQPPLSLGAESVDPQRVMLMSNPAVFKVNEVVVGVSTQDILFHLGTEEVERGMNATKGRLIRLSEHLITQKSFYPLFPPSTKDAVNLDLRHYEKITFEETPDVLILSSKLNHFAGRVNQSLCCNPGQLAKGSNGGTFARITINAPKLPEGVGGDEEISHQIPDRTCVEIVRI